MKIFIYNFYIQAKLQQEILNGYDEKHQTEVKNLRSQLLEISEEKEREIETRKAMEGDLRNRITDFSKRIVALESEFLDKKNTDVETVNIKFNCLLIIYLLYI